MAAKPKAQRARKKKATTARELLKLPQEQQRAILEAAAAAAEHEYRTNPELNLDLSTTSGLNGNSASAR